MSRTFLMPQFTPHVKCIFEKADTPHLSSM
jgi:hypothetical protein